MATDKLVRSLPLLCALVVLAGVAQVTSADTCFFTLGRSNDTWWFVEPNGKPFFSLGIDAVTYWGDLSQTTNRNAYYEYLISQNITQPEWATQTLGRLTSWNFNTLGAWSDSEITSRDFPYTVLVPFLDDFMTNNPRRKNDFKPPACVFPDVWHPDWVAYTQVTAKNFVTPHRNNPKLLGYFLDNEMFWGKYLGGDDYDWRYKGSILDQMLTCHNYTAPGREFAWMWLRDKVYNGSIIRLNQAWNTSYTNFKNITSRPLNQTAQYLKDCETFAGLAAEQYFKVTSGAVRSYDDRHLLLGGKFAGPPSRPVLEKCAQYNNVTSIDHYPTVNNTVPSRTYIENIFNVTRQPLLIAEFSYRGNDTELPNSNPDPKIAGFVVPTQKDRGHYYHRYTMELADLPFMVGFHWFEYTDQPKEGRSPDGENSNYGVVTVTNQVYTDLTNNMTATNNALPHAHGPHNFTFAQEWRKCVSQLSCLNGCSGRGCCNTTSGVCKCNSGYSFADCSTDNTRINIVSFGTNLNATVWDKMSGWAVEQTWYNNNYTYVNSSQLKLAIAPCNGVPACGNQLFLGGGVMTKSTSYGYGTYTAQIKTPANPGFSVVMELNSRIGSKDNIIFTIDTRPNGKDTLYVRSSLPAGWEYAGLSPIGNLSLAFHSYTINYFPDLITFYVDSHHVANVSITSAAGFWPAMGLQLYIKDNDAANSTLSDVASVRAVSYQLTNATVAVC